MAAKILLYPKSGLVSPVVPPGYCAEPDGTIEALRRAGIPVTRENYIDRVTNFGELEWTAEHEAMLPPELQNWDALEAEYQAELKRPEPGPGSR